LLKRFTIDDIPEYANRKLNLGSGLDRFTDLTPYLSGGNIEQYPNLANIPSAAWQCGVWEGRLYGLPSYASPGNLPGYLFYRKDIFDAAGVSPDIGNADDLFALGKQLTDANRGQSRTRRSPCWTASTCRPRSPAASPAGSSACTRRPAPSTSTGSTTRPIPVLCGSPVTYPRDLRFVTG
jgi:hypothetical protein